MRYSCSATTCPYPCSCALALCLAPVPCPYTLSLCPAPVPRPCTLPLCLPLPLCPAPVPSPCALPCPCPAPVPRPYTLSLCPVPVPCPCALPLYPVPVPWPSAPAFPITRSDHIPLGRARWRRDRGRERRGGMAREGILAREEVLRGFSPRGGGESSLSTLICSLLPARPTLVALRRRHSSPAESPTPRKVRPRNSPIPLVTSYTRSPKTPQNSEVTRPYTLTDSRPVKIARGPTRRLSGFTDIRLHKKINPHLSIYQTYTHTHLRIHTANTHA